MTVSIAELIKTLEQDKNDRIQAIQADAEKEAEALRRSGADSLAAMRREHEAQIAEVREREIEELLADADDQARRGNLMAENKLAERLSRVAAELLPSLRKEKYPEVFAALVSESPRRTWHEVRVNPDDLALAARHFPEARIASDSAISGGFIAGTESGRATIDNTFEKRLARAWDMLLPKLLNDLCRELF